MCKLRNNITAKYLNIMHEHLEIANNFMPHGHCIQWNMTLVIGLSLANLAIAVSYFSIPYYIYKFVNLSGEATYVTYNKMILMLASMFIISCGVTHLIDIVTMWIPLWYLDLGARMVTALFSIATAGMLPKFVKNQLGREDGINDLRNTLKKLLEDGK